ncbi:MAG: hypothetical protein OCD01_19460 [Fibrobacterales bacterium]
MKKSLFLLCMVCSIISACSETGSSQEPDQVTGIDQPGESSSTLPTGPKPVVLKNQGLSTPTFDGEIVFARLDTSVYNGPAQYIWQEVNAEAGESHKNIDTTDVPFNGFYFTHDDDGYHNITTSALTPGGMESEPVQFSWNVSVGIYLMGIQYEIIRPEDSIAPNVSKQYLLKDPYEIQTVSYYAVTYNKIEGKEVPPYKQEMITGDTLIVSRATLPDNGDYVVMIAPVFADGTKGKTRVQYLRSVGHDIIDHRPIYYIFWGTDGKGTKGEDYGQYRANTRYYHGMYRHGSSVAIDFIGEEGYMFDSLEILSGTAQVEYLDKQTSGGYNAMLDSIQSDLVVKAHFKDREYSVSYKTRGGSNVGAGGTIAGPDFYLYGTSFAITNTPDPGYTFVEYQLQYEGEMVGDSVLNPSGDLTINGIFAPDSFPLTVTTDGGGTVTGDSIARLDHQAFLSCTADSMYQLDSLMVIGGGAVFEESGVPVIHFPNKTTTTRSALVGQMQAVTVKAFFSPFTYKVSYESSRGTILADSIYTYGDTIIMDQIADSTHFIFTRFNIKQGGKAKLDSNKIFDVKNDITVTASYVLPVYSVSYIKEGSVGSVSGDTLVTHGKRPSMDVQYGYGERVKHYIVTTANTTDTLSDRNFIITAPATITVVFETYTPTHSLTLNFYSNVLTPMGTCDLFADDSLIAEIGKFENKFTLPSYVDSTTYIVEIKNCKHVQEPRPFDTNTYIESWSANIPNRCNATMLNPFNSKASINCKRGGGSLSVKYRIEQ